METKLKKYKCNCGCKDKKVIKLYYHKTDGCLVLVKKEGSIGMIGMNPETMGLVLVHYNNDKGLCVNLKRMIYLGLP